MRILLWLSLALWCGVAHAQTVVFPPTFTGQGIMTATGTSAPINTANVTPSGASAAFPAAALPNQTLRIKNQVGAAANIAVCWAGGTCSYSTGEIIQAGESQTKGMPRTNMAVNPPSVISQSGSISIEVEW